MILQPKNSVWYAQVSGTVSGGFNVGGGGRCRDWDGRGREALDMCGLRFQDFTTQLQTHTT